MLDFESLRARRLRNWCQDGTHKAPDPEAAKGFIERVGICTLFGASSEVPSLYQAYMSDPEPPIFASWDSPSGEVYSWRWNLGKANAAFYGAIVARKPTWVSFAKLPAVLGALMERRSPEELYEAGELSPNALRVAQALEEAGTALETGALRDRAGFPTGKEQRAAYLKAVDELDSKLILAKRFSEAEGDEGMRHGLVRIEYPKAAEEGLAMDPDEALAEVLRTILESAVYLDPKPLARHLRISPQRLETGFAKLERVREIGLGRQRLFTIFGE